MKRRIAAASIAGLVLVGGLLVSTQMRDTRAPDELMGASAGPERRSQPPKSSAPTQLVKSALGAAEIEWGLADVGHERERVSRVLGQARGRTVEELAGAVRVRYAEGVPRLTEELLASHSLVVAWDDAPPEVQITVRMRKVGSVPRNYLELDVRRSGGEGALVVCFPPGTYAVCAPVSAGSGERYSSNAQDLALLRAPVVVLEAGEDRETVNVPIACAGFEMDPPRPNQVYHLRRFPRGSLIESLLVRLCADELKRETESEVQLAVWIANNSLTQALYRTRPSLGTFYSGRGMRSVDGTSTARLLVSAGIDPRGTSFQLVNDPLAARAKPATDPVLLGPNAF